MHFVRLAPDDPDDAEAPDDLEAARHPRPVPSSVLEATDDSLLELEEPLPYDAPDRDDVPDAVVPLPAAARMVKATPASP